jgi:hypothetical protein
MGWWCESKLACIEKGQVNFASVQVSNLPEGLGDDYYLLTRVGVKTSKFPAKGLGKD